MEADDSASPISVRTYFVRGRNALVARAEFGDLFMDYYLHQGQLGLQHAPQHDEMFKEALAALCLHCASRPWHEVCAWTIHFQQPLLNLFVTGNNSLGTVTGQIFSDEAKDAGRNIFFSDLVKPGEAPRRSSVEFEGSDAFRAVERFYENSEQRPARYFAYGEEDFVMVTAQPQCDMEWFDGLTEAVIRDVDKNETLSLLETRVLKWECGCTQERMLGTLATAMRSDPEGLFGDEALLRMRCPRCGMKYVITREAMEAWVAGSK